VQNSIPCVRLWSPLSGLGRHIFRTGRRKRAAALSGEASSMALDATVVRQLQRKNPSAMESRGGNSSTFAPDGGNFRSSLPAVARATAPSVVAGATAAHVRAVASPAIIRAAARRHTGAAPHDRAASSAPHDRVALMKGSTPHHLGHRRSTRPEPHRLARSRLAPRRPALAASPTVSRCRSSQITAARRRPLPLWTG
jgi:hypothetical protein